MPVSNLVRNSALTTLLAFGLVACSDSPLAPRPIAPGGADALLSRGHDGNDSDADSDKGKSGSRTFTIVPGEAVKEKLGSHTLTMPANVVCEPETSGYGESVWDLPCTPINRPIEVTATWSSVDGQAVISFQPDLRFVPAAQDDEDSWVVLTVKHSKGIDESAYYAILWRNPETLRWVDESERDHSQRARAKKNLKTVSRRLKHFSDYSLWCDFGSYNVTSGFVEATW